jgi:hypothetical protein
MFLLREIGKREENSNSVEGGEKLNAQNIEIEQSANACPGL